MLFRRTRKTVPGLNATSTADISFMLLIFFLVISSMFPEKGLPTQLPPPADEERQEEQEVLQRNVLQLCLSAGGTVTCNGEPIDRPALLQRVCDFVANEADDPALPQKSTRELHLLGLCQVSDRHVVAIEVDRAATYDDYFRLRHTVALAYARLRNRMAQQRFGRPYAECGQEERDVVALCYPQRISETVTEAAGEGGRP